MQFLVILATLFSLAFPFCAANAQVFDDPGEESLHIPPVLILPKGARVECHTWAVEYRVPLLPMLFFDHPGEQMIPSRYRRLRSSGDTWEYADSGEVLRVVDEIGKYYDLLDIIGYRMRRDTNARLELQGCYSAEPGEDGDVAQERALVVREYLDATWGIDTLRMPILPAVPRADPEANTLLQEEARRVEFRSNEAGILAPVTFDRRVFDKLQFSGPVTLVPNLSPSEISLLEVVLLDEKGELVSSAEVSADPDSTRYNLDLHWLYRWSEEEKPPDHYFLRFRVRLTNGDVRSAPPVKLPLRVYNTEMTILSPYGYGGVPFFAPGESRLSSSQKELIREYLLREERWSIDGDLLAVAEGRSGIEEMSGRSSSEIAALIVGARERAEAAKIVEDGRREEEGLSSLRLFSRTGIEILLPSSWSEMGAMADVTFLCSDLESHGANSSVPYDTLGVERAESVYSFLRDSLDAPLAEDPDPGELISEQPAHRRSFYELAASTGIRPVSELPDSTISLLPEYRFYRRAVTLTLEPAPATDDRTDDQFDATRSPH